jgi:ferredoxin
MPGHFSKLEARRGVIELPYVVTEPCIGVKDKSCMTVCPVDCIYDGGDMVYINPDECIDCGLCEPECPVTAIFVDTDVPSQWRSFIDRNRELGQKLAAGK